MSDESAFVRAFNAELAAAREDARRDFARLVEGMPAYVPPSWRVRVRRWPRLTVRRARDRVARWIAPWLDDEY